MKFQNLTYNPESNDIFRNDHNELPKTAQLTRSPSEIRRKFTEDAIL